MNRSRSAFTLIELMVVIGIIVVLAGITVPVVGVVKRMVKDARCDNNLRQIATAITAFKADHADRLPYYLCTVKKDENTGIVYSSLTKRGEGLELPASLFICPRDESQGTDEWLGRCQSGWDNLTELHEDNCSYLYEASGREISSASTKRWFLNKTASESVPSSLTWAQGKAYQLRFGNYLSSSSNERGGPFPADRFPIIRCFYHYRWNQGDTNVQKVKAVSWNMNVFQCSPLWEHDVDSRF
jgi:prepilin-type N-terminal cleavage/methylation domain-containing protein